MKNKVILVLSALLICFLNYKASAQETVNRLSFFGINMDQHISNFGCSEADLAIKYFNSMLYGSCLIEENSLNSADKTLKGLFDILNIVYKSDNPKNAVAIVGDAYIKDDPDALNNNFYSANNLIRKQFGNPSEVAELENEDAVYLWDNDNYRLILIRIAAEGNLRIIYTIDKGFK